MPHSSGGGSHGGGSHGGGGGGFHHGGGYGRSYIPPVSHHYYPGARCYIYYDRHHFPHTIYTARTDEQLNSNPLVRLITMILVVIGPIILILLLGLHTPRRLATNYNTEIVIEDTAEVMNEQEEKDLKKTFQTFYDKTGITPAMLTITPETRRYGSLETYAYSQYINRFHDERHWLFVYYVDNDPEYYDWSFEGMQGNDTDVILYSQVTKKFNKTVTDNLMSEKGVSESFIAGFNKITPHIMNPYIYLDKALIVFMVVWGGVGALLIVSAVFDFNNAKQIKTAYKVDKAELTECPYCGASYYKGTIKQCLKCGAILSEEDDFNTSESEISEF